MERCLNCQAPQQGRYCFACGQRFGQYGHSIFSIFGEYLESLFNYDNRLYRTLASLALKPGKMSRQYTAGKRARYVPPVRLYVATTLILFLLLSWSDVALMSIDLKKRAGAETAAKKEGPDEPGGGMTGAVKDGVEADTEANAAKAGPNTITVEPKWESMTVNFFILVKDDRDQEDVISDSMINLSGDNQRQQKKVLTDLADGFNAVVKDPHELNRLINIWLPRVMILLLPMLAVTLKLFYIRRGEYLVNHAIFSLHLHTAMFFYLLLFLVLVLLANGRIDGNSAAKVYAVGVMAYSLFALKGFYGQGWVKTSMKWAFLLFSYFFLAITALISAALIFYRP